MVFRDQKTNTFSSGAEGQKTRLILRDQQTNISSSGSKGLRPRLVLRDHLVNTAFPGVTGRGLERKLILARNLASLATIICIKVTTPRKQLSLS
jgi:hypothetical protein